MAAIASRSFADVIKVPCVDGSRLSQLGSSFASKLKLPSRLLVRFLCLFAVLAAAGAAVLLLRNVEGFDSSLLCLTTDDVGHFVRHFSTVLGPWTALGSIILLILHSFIPLPAEIIAVANGIIFGSYWGVVVTWTGAMLGALLSFGLTRLLGRDVVHYFVDPEKRQSIERWFERPSTLIFVRLIPAISFNLINYAAGLSGVGWWRFTWTTAVGILPLTIITVVLGERLANVSWWVWVILGAAVLMLWWGLHRFGPQFADRVFGGRSVR